MRIHRPIDVLQFWEETYEVLEPKWKQKFIEHKAMKRILKYKSDQIKVAIRRNKRLDNVLGDLIQQADKKEDFLRKQNQFYDANQRERSSSKIENREREGNRWGRSF